MKQMTENIDHLADAATAQSPWLASREVWKLLNALSPGLLLQPWMSVTGGLQLLATRASILMTDSGVGLAETQQTSTIWLAVGRFGLNADLWLPDAPIRFRELTKALPWVDLESGALWFFGHRYRGPFVRVDVKGIHPSSDMPTLDLIAYEGGFDSARARVTELAVSF